MSDPSPTTSRGPSSPLSSHPSSTATSHINGILTPHGYVYNSYENGSNGSENGLNGGSNGMFDGSRTGSQLFDGFNELRDDPDDAAFKYHERMALRHGFEEVYNSEYYMSLLAQVKKEYLIKI